MLRPDYIVDSRLGVGKGRETLAPRDLSQWMVCRHDLAEAWLTAAEHPELELTPYIVGTLEADATCNTARAREILVCNTG